MDSDRSNLSKLLYGLAFKIENRKREKKAITLQDYIIKLPLEVAGFGCLTYAGFQINSLTGWITTGVLCFVASWHFGGKETSKNVNALPQRR